MRRKRSEIRADMRPLPAPGRGAFCADEITWISDDEIEALIVQARRCPRLWFRAEWLGHADRCARMAVQADDAGDRSAERVTATDYLLPHFSYGWQRKRDWAQAAHRAGWQP